MDIQGKAILVVEDEAVVAIDMTSRLRVMGLNVVKAVATGEQALAFCEEQQADAILMDVRIRGKMDGIEAAAQVRERWQIPVIFLTAHSDSHTLARITRVEPYGYLLKPFDERALWVTLHTALSRREQELAREAADHARTCSDARFREVLEHSHDGIVSIDGDQHIVIFNGGAERMFGRSSTEMIGRSLGDLVPELVQERHWKHVEATLRGATVPKLMTLREVQGRRRSGELFPVEVSLSRLSLNGEVTVTAIVRDLTERQALERKMLHAQKMETVGRLVSAVAHDFNNQLVPIVGYAELLCRCLPPTDTSSREDAEEIRSAASRAARLTRQLLLFGRQDAEVSQMICVDDVLKALSGTLVRLVGADRSLELKLGASGMIVKLDPTSLEQIVFNLVVNARDAMPEGGHIYLTTDISGRDTANAPDRKPTAEQRLRLRVRDTGTGIDSETLEHIFEPFFTTKPAGVGSGIGLATVHGILARAKGSIDVASDASAGTTFTVQLPLSGGTSGDLLKRASSTSTPVRLSGSNPCAVMVVDSDDAVRLLAGRVLSTAGYDVTLARTPRQAIAACPKLLHVLVADAVLPGTSGAQLAKQLIANHGCGVVLTTGYLKAELEQHGMLPEHFAILQKPYGAEGLEQAVAEQHRHSSC